MKLIDKDKVAAEIEKRIKTNKECMLGLRNLDYYKGKIDALNDTLSFLDTLETKEVNLEEDVDRILEEYDWNYDKIDFYEFARHFYELGLKAKEE